MCNFDLNIFNYKNSKFLPHTMSMTTLSSTSTLEIFLENHRIKDDSNKITTHCSMGFPYGKFHISEDDMAQFYEIYADHVKKGKPAYIIERHSDYIVKPLLIDLDFDMPIGTTRKYKSTQLLKFVQTLHQVISTIYNISNSSELQYIITEKLKPTVKETRVKDGFHLICPNMLVTMETMMKIRQEFLDKHLLYVIFPGVMEECTNDEESIYDKSVFNSNGWFLLGSGKPDGEPYKITHIYNIDSDGCIYDNIESKILMETKQTQIEYVSIRNKSYASLETETIHLKNRSVLSKITITSNALKTTVMSAVPVISKPYKQTIITPDIVVAPTKISKEKTLLTSVINELPEIVANDYTNWLTVGMACFNEGLTMAFWDEWSRKSNKYKASECARKWHSFKDSTITQATLWFLLKKFNPPKFTELQIEREDFKRLIENPTHAEMAIYFFNNNPHDYLYDTLGGWFNVMPNNVWENSHSIPSTLRNKITKFFKTERLQLEVEIARKKLELADDKDVVERLDKITRKCLDFKNKIESDGFQRGMINNLSGYYAERAAIIMENCGIAPSEGIISIFDSNPNIWAFTDCVYDFTHREFRQILPTDYITITCGYKKTEVNLDVRANIMKILTDIWESREDVDYMLSLISSCLCGVRNMEVFSILTGRGGNGKGLLWAIVMNTFGGYYKELKIASLTKGPDSSSSASDDLAVLRGMRCVGTSEPEADEKLHEGTIKLLTGGDNISCRPLYGKTFTYKPQFGLFIQCNNIPVFNNMTQGGVRRNRVIPFPFNFVENPTASYERKGDPHVKNVLAPSEEWRNEFFYILLEYYNRIAGKSIDAIHTSKRVVDATREYTEDNDKVGSWFRENYEKCEDSFVRSKEVYEHFKSDTGLKISDREFKHGLVYNQIDIKQGTKVPTKGIMLIYGWKSKTVFDELINPE